VLCLESCDLREGQDLAGISIDDLGGLTETVRGARAHARSARAQNRDWPYDRDGAFTGENDACDVELIPYFDWANRGPSTMRVWLPLATSPDQ
jgi:DUF1680 family protein